MTSTLNLSLTDELRAFVDASCGDGTLYSTPSEFLRDVLREKKRRMDAADLRMGILEGFDDILHGRVVEFQGNIHETMAEMDRREAEGWK